MLTASGMLKKCGQRASMTVLDRNRATVATASSPPVMLHTPPVLHRERPIKTGHALYDQLMKSHDRVRPRRG